MRAVFSDGTNSVAHFALGVISYHHWLVGVGFAVYEHTTHANFATTVPAFAEFALGWFASYVTNSRL
jgi:hypothetical protein